VNSINRRCAGRLVIGSECVVFTAQKQDGFKTARLKQPQNIELSAGNCDGLQSGQSGTPRSDLFVDVGRVAEPNPAVANKETVQNRL